jgi:N-methylhydantoinase A
VRQLGLDVGGTFTDCVVYDANRRVRAFKSSTTPAEPAAGVLDVLDKAAAAYGEDLGRFLAEAGTLVHGTTLGTNVLLSKRGAKTGFLTTAGFREVLAMRRGVKNLRGSMFDQFRPPYEPLVPRRRVLGVPERTLHTGEVLEPVDDTALAESTRQLLHDGCESIAIGFLHSYVNPANERAAAALVRELAPDRHVVASHEVRPIWREFERFSTTAVSAYIGPAVEGYLRDLDARLRSAGFAGSLLIMQSNGLVQSVEECAGRGVYLITSGPAAAPFAARSVAGRHGRGNVLAVDMGGTSFDMCLIRDREMPTTTDSWVGEERVAIKRVDVATVAAGGSSIAWVDSLGLLRVGPQSAGSDPGPAAYGRSISPTITDADLLLGYIPADYFLGGELTLNVSRAREAIERLGSELGLDATRTAEAVYDTATAFMADEVAEICTRKGHDVRELTVVAGGGAGGVHAAAIARRLGVREVIFPSGSAVLSAFGMLTMDLGLELSRSSFTRGDALGGSDVGALYAELESEAREATAGLGVAAERLGFARTVEMRYEGQFHELEIDVEEDWFDGGALDLERLVESFHVRYERLYGYDLRWRGVELLTFHLRVLIARDSPVELADDPPADGSAEDALRGSRRCRLHGQEVEVPVYDADLLGPGHRLSGPALVDSHTTTVLVLDGFACAVDPQHNLVLRAQEGV